MIKCDDPTCSVCGSNALYWFRFGGWLRVPTVHAPGCAWYGQGAGVFITPDQRDFIDPKSKAKDCKRCGGMWADFDLDAYGT